MQRSVFAVIIAALVAIATFGGRAFVWAAPHTTKASQRPEGDWRILDPVTYENIAIFPVVSGSSQDTSSFLTLEEGLATVTCHHSDPSARREHPYHLVEHADRLRHQVQRGKTAHHVECAVVEGEEERVAAHVDRA